MSHLENRMSLDRHCSLQTFNKSFLVALYMFIAVRGLPLAAVSGVTSCSYRRSLWRLLLLQNRA